MNPPRNFPQLASPRLRVFLAALVTVVLWASAFIVIRDAGEYFSAGPLALLRMASGALTLTPIALIHGVQWPNAREWGLIGVFGVGWFGGYNLLLNTAEQTLDAGTAAMIVNIAPLIVVLLGGVLLKEGYPKPLLIGAPLSFSGVALISVSNSGGLHLGEAIPVLLTLAAALLYGGCTLIQKHTLKTADAITMTWLGAVLSVLVLLPYAPTTVHELQHAPASAAWSTVYLGVFPTAIAFITWAYVLKRLSAGKTSTTTYVVPAIAILMSWALLGEVPTLTGFIGGALCLIGVWVTRLPASAANRRRKIGVENV